jgi:anthranilate synthase component 2
MIAAESSPKEARVLVLDNRDSFVFNLVDEFRTRGARVMTVRSGLSLESLDELQKELSPDLVVLSPGPGRPEDAGITLEWLRTDPAVPVLGICLGHQALAVAAGGEVSTAARPVHGEAYWVTLAPDPLFAGVGETLKAARYHSLVVTRVPSSMRVIATCQQGDHTLVMALRHQTRCRVGFQFHPESILTPHGRVLLHRFLDEACAYRRTHLTESHLRSDPVEDQNDKVAR